MAAPDAGQTRTGLPWLILAQLVVTLALLGVVVVLDDSTARDLVLGGTIAHWLREGPVLGRQVSEQIEVKRAIAAPETVGS